MEKYEKKIDMSTNDELIKNIYLKEWIKKNYPGMIEDGESCLIELDYFDMDKFAFWLQDKIYQETLKEKIEQLRDELYEQLPSGEVHALKIISEHIKKLDELI